jgi:AcrR family transcriptional regulator
MILFTREMESPQCSGTVSPVAKDQPAHDLALQGGLSRRDLAVARSLDSARNRAENRVQRFLDAAVELINNGSNKEFTVQEVVERSGQSLRSFYQYFDGKYELLLALFEESVRTTAEVLRGMLAGETDDLERLHRFVVEYFRICEPATGPGQDNRPVAPVMADFAQRLLTAHPKEAARAFAPLVSLFREILEPAIATGAVRPKLPEETVTGVVLEAIMFNAFSATIGGASVRTDDGERGEQLWELLFLGVATDEARRRVDR